MREGQTLQCGLNGSKSLVSEYGGGRGGGVERRESTQQDDFR